MSEENVKIKDKPNPDLLEKRIIRKEIMKNLEADFIAGSVSEAGFPGTNLPEVAFAGRSNVGKSSLLNSIVLRKNLARISTTPGKTQQINFYKVENKWSFADLPGFGYAVVSKTERDKWSKLNLTYLEKRKNLKLVCVLIDSRHDPMEHDLGLIEWLEHNKKDFIIILTKTDKISKKAVAERKAQVEELVQYCEHALEVLPYSSLTNEGRAQLMAVIRKSSENMLSQ